MSFATWGKNTPYKYNQASKEEILAASDVQTTWKEMTPPSVNSALTNSMPHDRRGCELLMQVDGRKAGL